MNLLHIFHTFYPETGGVQSSLLESAKYLTHHNINNCLLTMRYDDSIINYSKEYFKIISPQKKYSSKSKLLNDYIFYKYNLLRFNTLNIKNLQNELDKFDLLICHSLRNLYLVSKISKLCDINWITFFHGRIGNEKDDIYMDFYIKKKLFESDKIIVNRKSSYLPLKKIYGNKVIMLDPYVDTKKYLFRYKKIDDVVEILYLGRLINRRNPELVLYSLYEFKKKYKKNIRCHFVGDGNMKEELMYLTDRLNLNSDVIFHGSIDDVKLFLNKCHISLYTSSITNYPSKSLLECMSSGVAVISTSSGESAMLVKDYHTGLLVSPNDCVQMACAINELVKNQALYKKIVINARKKAESIDIENFVRNYKKIIEMSI